MFSKIIVVLNKSTTIFIILNIILFLSGLVLIPSEGLIRIFAAILLIFIIPGYLFLVILWPFNGSIEQIRRIALIIPTSVAIVGILLLIVNYFFVYQFEFAVVSLAIIELILVIAAFLRCQNQFSLKYHVSKAISFTKSLISQPWKTEHIVLGVSILIFIATLTYAFITPRQQRELTEFYLLDPSVFTVDHPYVEKQGDPLNVPVAVHNLESGTHEYGIEIWAVDPQVEGKRQLVNNFGGFSLQAGEILESSLSWSMPWVGEGQGVEIMLFIDDEPEPYRHLILELDIEE